MDKITPFRIVGEVDGIPVKRYAMAVRGLKPKRLPLPEDKAILEKLEPLAPIGSVFSSKQVQFQVWNAADKRRKRIARELELLKQQRLAVLGPGLTRNDEKRLIYLPTEQVTEP